MFNSIIILFYFLILDYVIAIFVFFTLLNISLLFGIQVHIFQDIQL